MAKLTEEMVIARTKHQDLSTIKKLNCWGAELEDVSVVRKMPNVEVLALSLNKLVSLRAFVGCERLRELYVRKNCIRELRELRHLRRLPRLQALWLGENPCADHPQYRVTVLRNLPRLEVLDNQAVRPEEVEEAQRRGYYIPDSDDEGYEQEECVEVPEGGAASRASSPDSSPDRGAAPRHASDSSEGPEARRSPPRRLSRENPARVGRPEDEGAAPAVPRAMTASYYESPAAAPHPAAMRHSHSAHTVKEYGYGGGGNGEARGGDADRRERSPEACCATPREFQREGPREYPSAVMGELRGFPRRPAARNSNLLSAVLCLVKELDYSALEVAEMAVRCRMDELANSQ